MDYSVVLVLLIIVVFFLILNGMWIFLSLFITGLLGIFLFTGYSPGEIVANVSFGANESFTLSCVPLFIFMGELLFRSGVSGRFYHGLRPLLEGIPGGLLHTNVAACTIFAAVSGSSAATCATIATVAVPALNGLGYETGISLGSLAGAGTLGLLIPPSIVLIIYGSLTGQSIGRLFLAGIIPGLLISALFMTYIAIRVITKPGLTPSSRHPRLKEILVGLLNVVPVIMLILLILGLIYTGITTPTEAGAIGVGGAFGMVVMYKQLKWQSIKEASLGAVRTTCMLMLIITGASVLSVCLAYLRIPQQLAAGVEALGLSKYLLLAIICIIYLGLGCLFDGASMMILTLPIIFPVILALGFDPIWFGVLLTILIEIAQVTPPVGFNLYILQTISGRSIDFIVKNTFPFFALMVFAIVLIILFPKIVLWLPSSVM